MSKSAVTAEAPVAVPETAPVPEATPETPADVLTEKTAATEPAPVAEAVATATAGAPIAAALAGESEISDLPATYPPARTRPKPVKSKSFKDTMEDVSLYTKLAYEGVMHTAMMRNASHGWDLKTHMTVSAIREFMINDGKTVEELQEKSKMGIPYENDAFEAIPMWACAPDAAMTDCLVGMIKSAAEKLTEETKMEKPTIPEATVEDVLAEWVIDMRMKKEFGTPFFPAADDIVVIYAHGGAHYMGSAAAHRFITSELAQSSDVRVLSLDYRLSPQDPMPAAITDFLTAYLFVLNTCKLPCSQIFFAGDSAGGSIVLAALEVILYAEKKAIPVPAGAIVISPLVDLSRAMPSESSKAIAKFDYVPPGNYYPNIKPSKAWPVENNRYWVCLLWVCEGEVGLTIDSRTWRTTPFCTRSHRLSRLPAGRAPVLFA
ncbi:Alpha/Beta hydrolase protein [Limtongia smithiae]|uniref:Alpha/Beta hydrolase protein n=1 Tax=Limtongia smithiae TaxID=1125753 RepID=UPI0034CE801D